MSSPPCSATWPVIASARSPRANGSEPSEPRRSIVSASSGERNGSPARRGWPPCAYSARASGLSTSTRPALEYVGLRDVHRHAGASQPRGGRGEVRQRRRPPAPDRRLQPSRHPRHTARCGAAIEDLPRAAEIDLQRNQVGGASGPRRLRARRRRNRAASVSRRRRPRACSRRPPVRSGAARRPTRRAPPRRPRRPRCRRRAVPPRRPPRSAGVRRDHAMRSAHPVGTVVLMGHRTAFARCGTRAGHCVHDGPCRRLRRCGDQAATSRRRAASCTRRSTSGR